VSRESEFPMPPESDAPVITDAGSFGRLPPPPETDPRQFDRRSFNPRSTLTWMGMIGFALVAVLWLLALSISQATEPTVALPVHERGIAVITAIDELLDLPTGNADAIDEHMDRWLADHDRAEVVQRAQDLRVPFTEVFSPAEVLNDPHLAERGFFVELEYPELGTITQPGAPVQLGVTPWRSGRAPSLGEHTNDVLREWTESGAVP